VNPIDDKAIRQRLHAELGALEISPVPVIAVRRRGKAIRARRRAVTSGFAAVAVVAVLAVRAAQGPAPAPVTINPPGPGAAGGLFASGTAHGKPWRMAVRNIAADPGTPWCLPAVMFNGRDGDVLFGAGAGAANPSIGNPAFLDQIPGFPGVGAVFAQVAPQDTKLVATLPSGRQLTVRPVWVSACGQRFHLAGFVYADPLRGISQLSTTTRSGPDESLAVTQAHGAPGGDTGAGIWANLDNSRADIAASQAANTIGHGTVAGQIWHISASLGLYGQCYAGALRAPARSTNYGRTGSGHGQSSACVPVAAPPRTIALGAWSLPGGTADLSGYAGLVNPRTARVVVSFSGAPDITVRPVMVGGRAYVAFAVPPGCDVVLLRLIGASGRAFFTTAKVPPAK
jgi:hypothetical protein